MGGNKGKSQNKRQQRDEYSKRAQEGGPIDMPRKRFFRQRAHANPLSDHHLAYPLTPDHMDWASHYPAFVDPDPNNTNSSGARRLTKNVEIADIGCGFGGLLVGLAPLRPDTLMLGMEIRPAVLEYVRGRIQALRSHQVPPSMPTSSTSSPAPAAPSSPAPNTPTSAIIAAPGGYQNISGLRTNTMKFLPNFFSRHQLSAIFICFPDPHFKARKHKQRIVSSTINAEYAYVLRPGGKVYTITDVEDLHLWMVRHFEGEEVGGEGMKELFERVGEEEVEGDDLVKVMREETEEGKKVARNNGNKYVAVFRRKEDPEWPSN